MSVIQSNADSISIRLLFFHNIEFIDRDYPIIMAIQTYLNYSLFSKLRTEKGYIYDIDISPHHYDCGLNFFTISTSFTNKDVFKIIIKTILDEIKFLKTKYLQEEDLDRTKNELIRDFLILNLNKEPNRFSDYYSKYLLKNTNIVKFKEFYKMFKNLDEQKIFNVSRRLFKMKHLLLCYYGDKNYNNEIKELIPEIEFLK
jgi:predicted Zn-dependent peptidase